MSLYTCEPLESAAFRASAKTSRRRHGTHAPPRNTHAANMDVYRRREPLALTAWPLLAAAKSPCCEQGWFSPPRKARARRMKGSRCRDDSPCAARDPRGTDSLPQGCLAMRYLTHASQAYVATLYTAFEVDEETTQDKHRFSLVSPINISDSGEEIHGAYLTVRLLVGRTRGGFSRFRFQSGSLAYSSRTYMPK
jgi:hypothetical protein